MQDTGLSQQFNIQNQMENYEEEEVNYADAFSP